MTLAPAREFATPPSMRELSSARMRVWNASMSSGLMPAGCGMVGGQYFEGTSVKARPERAYACWACWGAVPSASHSRWWGRMYVSVYERA